MQLRKNTSSWLKMNVVIVAVQQPPMKMPQDVQFAKLSPQISLDKSLVKL